MHRRILSVLGVGFVTATAMMAGCDAALSPQARELLQGGTDCFERGDYAGTVTQMDTFLRDHARSRGVPRAYCLRGKAKHRLEDIDGARADLTEAADTKDSKVRSEASVVLGNIAYEQDDMALAENMYRQALEEMNPGDPLFGHGCFRLGCVLQRQGRWRDADKQYNKVIYHMEGSDIATQAARRVHRTTWTIQAGAFEQKKRAEADASQLRESSLPAGVKPEAVDRTLLHVVQVGRFPTYEQALAQLAKVRQHRADAFVTVTEVKR